MNANNDALRETFRSTFRATGFVTNGQAEDLADAAIRALGADRGEAVAWMREYTSSGALQRELEWNDSPDGDKRGDWIPLFDHRRATPPSPAESAEGAVRHSCETDMLSECPGCAAEADPFAAKLRADILTDDSLTAAPSQVSPDWRDPFLRLCDLGQSAHQVAPELGDEIAEQLRLLRLAHTSQVSDAVSVSRIDITHAAEICDSWQAMHREYVRVADIERWEYPPGVEGLAESLRATLHQPQPGRVEGVAK